MHFQCHETIQAVNNFLCEKSVYFEYRWHKNIMRSEMIAICTKNRETSIVGTQKVDLFERSFLLVRKSVEAEL